MPNLQVLTTSCVGLELRLLPPPALPGFIGITGLLRHPNAPSACPHGRPVDHPCSRIGAPRVARAFLVYMLPPLPRCRLGVLSLTPSRVSLPPEGSPGRPAHRPFRGLLGVHSRCGLHTRAVTVFRDPLSEGFRHFVTSMPAPVASGWSGRRVGLAPTGKRRLFTAHTHCRRVAMAYSDAHSAVGTSFIDLLWREGVDDGASDSWQGRLRRPGMDSFFPVSPA